MTDADAAAWDEFVLSVEGATFFHQSGWRTLFADIFQLRPRYLLAERDGRIVGILPLVHQKSLLFGNALIAAPFCVEGGTLAIESEARAALDRAAVDLMAETGASYVEFRSRKSSRPGWQVRKNLYATFRRALSSDDATNLLAIPRKQRAVVRKTLNSGLVSEVDGNADRLYQVYSESVRNLGTPMFPRGYFRALQQTFGADCDILIVIERGQPISAVMNFYFKGTVMPYYGGGTPAARLSGANDFLYWEVMRRAALRGCHSFDFGRSKADTGAFAFKKNWGFQPQWLEYEYWLKPGAEMPEKNPTNPKYAFFIESWKRLPLSVANALGPFLIAGLG